jgi:RTX calcium-binding nonapeptide repeat (4 copies)
MSSSNTRPCSRQEARPSAARRTRGRARVSAPWLESLEDRTLLSFIGSLQNLEQNVLGASALGTSIPVLGTQLASFKPVSDIFTQFIVPLNSALATPTHDSLVTGVANALGSLLEGNVQVEPTSGNGPYTVSAHIHKDTTIVSTAPSTAKFGLGDFLNAQVTDNLDVTLDFDYVLNFTVQTDGSASLDPSPNSPMTVNLVGTLSGFAATGTLNNLLTASVTVAEGAKAPSFNVAFSINPHADGSVGVKDVQLHDSKAEATLGLALSFGSTVTIDPKIDVTLHVAWKDDGPDLAGTITDLRLSNIGLDVGDLLPGFLTKVIGDVQTYTKPLQPIANFFSAEVPGLNQLGVHLSLRSLADMDNEPGVGDFVDVVNLLNSLPSDANQGTGGSIKFLGDIQFAGNPLANIIGGGSDSNPIGSVSSDATDNSPSDLFSQADSMTADPGSSSGFLSEAQGSTGGSFGFAFPIVTDPVHTVFRMLAGQDADLITFHASASASLSGAVGAQFGPFSVFLTGSLAVHLNLSLGYDTHGLRKFIADMSDPTLLLDGLYFDTGTDSAGNANTGISLDGDIGVGAAALVVAVEGDLHAGAHLTFNPVLLSGPHADADPAHNKLYLGGLLDAGSLDKLFHVDGDVNISLNAEGGAFLGPIHVVAFSIALASEELINFDTAIYPAAIDSNPSIVPKTLYIDGKDGDQSIHVYTTETVKDFITRNETEAGGTVLVGDIVETHYQTIVDYGDHKDTYDLGYVSRDLVNNTSRYYFDPFNQDNRQAAPDYDLIAIGQKDGGGEYSGNHTITIDPSAIGGIVVEQDGFTPAPDPNNPANPLTEPLNAALVGGKGDDIFINHGTGHALLVGNGGSNDLEGGVLEYGNYVNPRPTGNFTAGLWPFNFPEPQPVKDELDQSQTVNDSNFSRYVSHGIAVPGVGANDLVGTIRSDILIGGPRGNTFEGDGGSDQEFGGAGFDTYVVPGNVRAAVQVYSGVQDYTKDEGIFGGISGGLVEAVQAASNADELEVVYDESGTVPSFSPSPPPTPTPVTIATLGDNLPGDSDVVPTERPVQVKTGDTTITASGLAKVDLGGVDVATSRSITQYGLTGDSPYYISDLSVGNLSRTTVKSIEVSPNPAGRSASIVLAGTEQGGDQFKVDSASVPAARVTVPTVPNAPSTVPAHVTSAATTISAHESTTVTLNPAEVKPFTPAVTLIVDNIRPQDSLTLDGGGGGDNYVVDLDLNVMFYTDIQDSSAKGLDTLFINGGEFDRQLPVRVPTSLGQHTIALNGLLSQLFPASVPASPDQYARGQTAIDGGAQTEIPILLAGSNLGRTPVSFNQQVAIAPAYQESVTYVSPHNVEFENDLYQSTSLQQQSTVQVGFNDDVKFLKVLGLDTGNTFDVTGLSALVTTLYGSALGDVFNVGGASGANRPKTDSERAVAGLDGAVAGIIDGVLGNALKTGRISTVAGKVAKNLRAALDLGSNSAFLGTINASVIAAVSAGRKMAASGRASAIIGILNANLGILLNTIDVPPVFIASPDQKLYLDGDAGNDVTNVSDFAGQLFVNGFAGADVVNLGTDGNSGATGTASKITGTVTIGNIGGLTTLNVNDSADTGVRDVQIRSTSIVGLGPAIIAYKPRELAALNIIGTTGYQPGFSSGRFVILPRINTYDVLSTPGANNTGSLVHTTLTVLGIGVDAVSVLAASDKSLADKGVQGPLQIISPNHKTDLRIYGYVTPANASALAARNLIAILNPNGTNAQRVLKAMRSQATNLFASLVRRTKTVRESPRAALRTQSLNRARTAVSRKTSRTSVAVRARIPNSSRPAKTALAGLSAPSLFYKPPIIIDQDRVSGLTMGDITFGADELTSLLVSTPSGGRLVKVAGTPNQGDPGSVVTSLVGHGNDLVDVGNGSLERVRGTLNITNPPSHSSLIVDGSNDSGSQNATVSPGVISGLAPADITYAAAAVTNVNLQGGTGGNTFTVQKTLPATPVKIDGGAGANTLVGPNLANNWRVESNDAGRVHNVTFTRVGNLNGGSQADRFKLSDGANLSGNIDGGLGLNTLDMSAQKRDIVVNLALGTATAVAGHVASITAAYGGLQNSILVGNADRNFLIGGAGHNLLIGGGGPDQLNGGSGDNILIGSTTSYDLQAAALEAVMSEFARTGEDFLTRLTHLLSGNGANDPVMLNPGTVQSDDAVNILTGGTGPNWFFQSAGPDLINAADRKPGDVVTPF